MPAYPTHELPVAGGKNTTYEPEAAAQASVRDIQNMDWVDEFRTLRKVPGSSDVASATLGASLDSIEGMEFVDLDRVRKRKAVVLCNGNLYEVNPGSGFTQLTSGYDLGSEPLRSLVSLDRIHMTSPDVKNQPTGGVKFDGTRVTNWGVLAPGTEEIVVDGNDAIGGDRGWTNDFNNPSVDADVSIDGYGSIKINKAGTIAAQNYMWHFNYPIDLSTAGEGYAYLWLFLPSGMLQKLATSDDAIEVAFFTSVTQVDGIACRFKAGELLPGWNLLALDVANPDYTYGAGCGLSAITCWRIGVETATAATTFSDLRFDKLFYHKDGSPTAALNGAGSVTDTRTYRVAFLTEYGVLSNLGPASNSITMTAQQAQLTNVPTSTDPSVIARYIYADSAGDQVYRFLGTLDDNSTTTFDDNAPSGTLGSATAPIAGDTLIDNSPPPRFSSVTEWNNRIWGVDADNKSVIWVSDVNAPEAWRLVDQIQMETDVQVLRGHPYGLMVYASDGLWIISGDGITSVIRADFISDQLGANGFRSVDGVKAIHVVLRESDLFIVANPGDPWIVNAPVLNDFKALSPSVLPDVNVVHDRRRQRILVFDGGDTVLVYQYGTSGYADPGDGNIDPQDVRIGQWTTLSLPAGVDANDAIVFEREGGGELPEVWVAGSDGRVYRLNDPATTDWANDGGSAAVNGYVTYWAVPMGGGVYGRGEPHWLELSTNSATGGTVTVTARYLDGVDGNLEGTPKQFNVTVPAGVGRIMQRFPDMGRKGHYLELKLANATLGEDFGIRRARIHYLPDVGFSANG